MSHLVIGRGGTLRLPAFYRTGGTLIDPTNPRVDILNPSDVAVVTDAVPTRQSLGTYYYDFDVPEDAPLGIWTAHWTGAINNGPVEDDDVFEVVVAGDVGFAGAALAQLEDFEERKGDVPDAQHDQVTALLGDAGALILSEAGEVDWSSTVPAVVKAICVEVAYRAWTNPDGLKSSTIGGAAVVYGGGDGGRSALFLTDDEVATVRRAAGGRTATSVTLVTPYSGDDEDFDDVGDL